MKKALTGILSLVLLVSLLTLPAGAATDPDQFWAEHGEALAAQGISRYGSRPFRDGLMPVLAGGTMEDGYLTGQHWNYINEQAQLVDLNQGRFSYVFDFFEGLAAVIDKNTNLVGYIDTTGKLVIPCQFGSYSQMGVVWAPHFHNGQATVLKQNYTAQEEEGQWGPIYNPGTWETATIDKTGKLTSAYQAVPGLREGQYLIGDDGQMTDTVAEPEEPVPSGSALQLKISDEYGLLDTGLYYESTLTNTTDQPIQGYYALLTYFPQKYIECTGAEAFQAQVQPIDVNLAPGESTSLTLYSGFFGLANANLVWISFEDQAERDAFLADKALNGNSITYYRVENEQWLKDNFGITLLPAK